MGHPVEYTGHFKRRHPDPIVMTVDTNAYIPARHSQLRFYKDVELYNRVEGKGFVLYKQAGLTLTDMRLEHQTHPELLYIRRSDKLKGLQEAQKGFNRQLENDIRSRDPDRVKETLVTVVEETLTEPRSGSLEGISDTVDIMVSDYAKESDVVRNLIDMSYSDYSTVLHSINVMAFALGFAAHLKYSRDEAKILGMAALLHDVGKTKIDAEILTAPRKLTSEEFQEIKRHTVIGSDILRQCRFGDKRIHLAALEHHEKLDGSGYPHNKTRISQSAQIIGLIDCYEALTNDQRPYRSAMPAFDTLDDIIGKDVRAGKFNGAVYCQFVKSLGAVSN